jgi:two-component system, OmpR family, response regulator VicR
MEDDMAPRVTVVNDSPEFLELVHDILADERIPTVLVDGDKPDALGRIRESRPDVLMIDLRMGSDELHGWDIAQEIRRDSELSEVPILVCSADPVALESIREQLDDTRRVGTLTKPFSIDHLIETIAELHEPAR